jgi:hypothetical protein
MKYKSIFDQTMAVLGEDVASINIVRVHLIKLIMSTFAHIMV